MVCIRFIAYVAFYGGLLCSGFADAAISTGARDLARSRLVRTNQSSFIDPRGNVGVISDVKERVRKHGAVIHAPGTILAYTDLPAHLQNVGKTLFGSPGKVEEVMKKMSPIGSLLDNGISLLMVAASRDDTLSRLQSEMQQDRYSIQKITKKDGVIIDIGSNIGDVSILAAKMHPKMQIVAFEPAPSTYFFLRLNLWLNGVPELEEADLGHLGKVGVLALHHAVTNDGRQVEVRWIDSNSQNAAVDTHEELVATWSAANVPSVALPDFLKQHNVNNVRLLKIDCEGCEFEVIPAMRSLLSDKSVVERFVGEVHQSLKSSGKTDAAKPSADNIKATDETLAARGCAVGSWAFDC